MPKDRTLKCGGQKSVAEAIEPTRRNQPAIEHDETGQIAAFGAKSIGGPGAHARAALLAVPGMNEVIGVGVLREIGRHRTDNSQIVDALGDMWE